MLTINKKISSYNHYKYNNIKYLIIHYVGAVSSAKNNVDYFYGGDRNASCHYFVDNNEIWQSVEDFHGAWHIGNSKTEPKNGNSLGIEMCLQADFQVSEQTEKNTLELAKHLMDKYNIPIENVRTHAEVTNYGKICPNWNDNNWARWNDFKAKLSGKEIVAPTPPPQPPVDSEFEKAKRYNTPRCKELQTKLKKCGYDIKWIDGIYGQNSHSCLGQFQRDFSLTVDYLAGNNTFVKLNERILQLNPPRPQGNDWVRRLQAELNKQGFRDRNGNRLVEDGLPGSLTLSACPLLKVGNRGNITRLMQERLGKLDNDGIFGNGTKNRVISYQGSKGLSKDGIVGNGTWGKLLGL